MGIPARTVLWFESGCFDADCGEEVDIRPALLMESAGKAVRLAQDRREAMQVDDKTLSPKALGGGGLPQ